VAPSPATIAADRIAVVTAFATDQLAIATKRHTRPPRHAATPTVFDGKAVAGTPVAARGIAVVAGFIEAQDSVPALVDSGGGLAAPSRGKTGPSRLNLTFAVAPVVALGIAVAAP
jgi:hypothetical protein